METAVPVDLESGLSLLTFGNSGFLIEEIWKKKIYDRTRRIRKGDVVVDIGANIGVFAVYAASQGATVFCFEPVSYNYDLLRKNVERNGLSDRIFHWRLAVSDSARMLSMHCPDPGDISASLMATVKRGYLETVPGMRQRPFHEEVVEAISLEQVLAKVPGKEISLLKMDCEGAEVDILRGAGEAGFRRVARLAMETHGGYSQKELFHRLRNLGHTVRSFKKLSGPLSVGFLDSERSGKASRKPPETRVYAIVKESSRIPGQGYPELDASDSFLSSDPDAELRMRWFLGSREMGGGGTLRWDGALPRRGYHSLRLVVEHGAIRDRARHACWVFEPGYGSGQESELLTDPGKDRIFDIEGNGTFRIPSTQFPRPWVFRRFVILVASEDKRQLRGNLELNGIKRKLSGWCRQLAFPRLPAGWDANFKLSMGESRRCKIVWWTE